jgi:hypothetical protein
VTDYVEDLHRRSDTDILTERLRLRAITGCLIERMVHARIATLIETPAALSQLETAPAGSVGGGHSGRQRPSRRSRGLKGSAREANRDGGGRTT